MRFQRILLVQPGYPGGQLSDQGVSAPLGLGYVAEVLRRHGVACRAVDLGLGRSAEDAARAAIEFGADAIALSMMTFRYKHHYGLARQLREQCPGRPIVAGGPHVTAWRDKVLDECPALDFGICFEGEWAMLELCQGRPLDEVGNLIYRDRGRVLSNPPRGPEPDLDRFPFPTFEGFELDRYAEAVPICSSRGCPHRCIFCQSRSVLGPRWRARSAANVADELQYWYERGRRLFSFVDDNFTLARARVEQLCDEIERRGLTGARYVAAGVRADKVDRALLARLRAAGFSHLAFGVESGSERILRILKKRESLAVIEAAMRNAADLGFRITLYFIVGSPHETLDDVKASIRLAKKYPIEDAYFSNLMPIPGTELFDWIRRHGRLLQEPEEYLNDVGEFDRVPLFDAPGMTLPQRRRALEMTAAARLDIQERARRRRERAHTHERFASFGLAGHVLADLYTSRPGLLARRLARAALERG